MSDHLNPCRCGHPAQFYRSGYGRAHWGVCCTKCDQDMDLDHTQKFCRKKWNEANPAPTADPKAAP